MNPRPYHVYSRNTGFFLAGFRTEAEAQAYCGESRDRRWTYHVQDKKVPFGC